MHTPIVSLTGTKGKTTIARVLDGLFQELDFDTLRVDTDGHYVNGAQRSNYDDSNNYWGFVPNICPGRFLYDLPLLQKEKRVAILEAAIGSSRLWGLGYYHHEVGVFTNIYREHITGERIKHMGDIYKAKRFIFKHLSSNGTFIFNASDSFLTQRLSKERIPQTKIAVGEFMTHFDEADFLKAGNKYIRIEGSSIVLRTLKTSYTLLDTTTVPFTFNGGFRPNIYNSAFALAVLLAQTSVSYVKKNRKKIQRFFDTYEVDPTGGRLVQVHSQKKDVTTIIDFAHERQSLKAVADLARQLAEERVIGVLRIDPRRLDKDIMGTAAEIGPYFDTLYVYDKVDGVRRKRSSSKINGKFRGVGETVKLFAKGLSQIDHRDFTIELQEQNAFISAYEDAEDGDVIIYIAYGDDHKGAYDFVKKVMK